MWRKVLGYVLIVGSIGIWAVAASTLQNPKYGIWTFIGQCFLGLVFFFQGRVYVRGQQPVTTKSNKPLPNMPVGEIDSFDPIKRRKLIDKLKGMTGPKVITVEEYFDGNISDQGAIGPNLWPNHPGVATFASCLTDLKRRDDVKAVYVEVAEIDPDNDSWPYTDRVYIFGDISDAMLKEVTSALQPTEIGDRKDIFSPIHKSVRSLHEDRLHVLWWD